MAADGECEMAADVPRALPRREWHQTNAQCSAVRSSWHWQDAPRSCSRCDILETQRTHHEHYWSPTDWIGRFQLLFQRFPSSTCLYGKSSRWASSEECRCWFDRRGGSAPSPAAAAPRPVRVAASAPVCEALACLAARRSTVAVTLLLTLLLLSWQRTRAERARGFVG